MPCFNTVADMVRVGDYVTIEDRMEKVIGIRRFADNAAKIDAHATHAPDSDAHREFLSHAEKARKGTDTEKTAYAVSASTVTFVIVGGRSRTFGRKVPVEVWTTARQAA